MWFTVAHPVNLQNERIYALAGTKKEAGARITTAPHTVSTFFKSLMVSYGLHWADFYRTRSQDHWRLLQKCSLSSASSSIQPFVAFRIKVSGFNKITLLLTAPMIETAASWNTGLYITVCTVAAKQSRSQPRRLCRLGPVAGARLPYTRIRDVDHHRVGRGSNFLDPTLPDPQMKRPNPTRPKINMKLWTRPSLTHLARLSVFDYSSPWRAPHVTTRQKERPNNRNGINK